MFGSSRDGYDKERATNMSAVTAQLGDSSRTMNPRESILTTLGVTTTLWVTGLPPRSPSPAPRWPPGSTGRTRTMSRRRLASSSSSWATGCGTSALSLPREIIISNLLILSIVSTFFKKLLIVCDHPSPEVSWAWIKNLE